MQCWATCGIVNPLGGLWRISPWHGRVRGAGTSNRGGAAGPKINDPECR